MPAGTTILDAALRAGLPMARACGAAGICSRCLVHVVGSAAALSGEDEREAAVKRRNRLDGAGRLACRARVRGDVEVSASYW